MNFWQTLMFAFWFFLPAGLGNMFPVIAGHVPFIKNWNYPMDFYGTFRGKRILGDHKTMRGLVIAVIFGALTAWVEKLFGFHIGDSNPILLGALLGLGAILGDAVKSFFKRQANIASGESWILFDQLDYILGGIIFSMFYVRLTVPIYLYIILVYFVLHLVVSAIGYLMHLKTKPI